MIRSRLLVVAALGVVAGCASEPDRALRVNLTIRQMGSARVRADCIKLAVLQDTSELKSLIIARPADDTAVFAVRRGTDLPQNVRLQVTGYLGTCADEATLKLNARADPVEATFPEKGVTAVDLTLDPPPASLDADRDGYVSGALEGVDCLDTGTIANPTGAPIPAASVFPGATQLCDVYADTDCDGTSGCDDGDCATAPACALPGDRFVIASNPRIDTMFRYECVGPFRVELQNAQGTRNAVRDMLVALTSSLPGTTLHVQAGCGDAAITSTLLPYDQAFFDVYLAADATAFGTTTLSATAPGIVTPGTATVQVRPTAIAGIAFASPPRSVTAGTCGAEAVTIEFRDAMGRVTAPENPATIAWNSVPSEAVSIFSGDAACSSEIATSEVMAGQSSVSVYVKARRAGTIAMSALSSTDAAHTATQNLTVSPAQAHALAFLNGELGVISTLPCSVSPLQIEVRDMFGNAVVVTNPVQVRVTPAMLTDLTFFSNSTCSGAAATDFTIPTNSSSVQVWVKPGAAGSGTVTATDPVSGLLSATQGIAVSAGNPTRLVFGGQAQSPLANACTTSPISIQLQDTANNPAASTSPITITFTRTPGGDATFGIFTTPGCGTGAPNTVVIPGGQTSAQLYFRGNVAVGSFSLSAAAAGLTLVAPSAGHSIRPNVPARLSFVAAALTAQADQCTATPFTLQVFDNFGNLTSYTGDQTVNVSSVPAGIEVGTGGACAGNSVTLPASANNVTFIAREQVARAYTLAATIGSITSTATPAATLTVTPGPSTLQVDTPAGGAATVTAGACQTVTLTRRDAFANLAPTSASGNTLTFGLGAGVTAYPNGQCVAGTTSTANSVASLAMNSTATITYQLKAQTAGSPTTSATLTPASQVANVTLTVNPGSPTLVFEAPVPGTPNATTASATQTAGGCTTVTIRRRDWPFNNDVVLGAAGNVTFTSIAAGMTIHTDSACATAGVTQVPVAGAAAGATFYVRSTVSGTPALQMALGGQNLTLNLTVNPGPSLFTAVTVPAGITSATAGQCVEARVTRRDSFGNAVPLPVMRNLTFTPTGPTTPAGPLRAFTSSTCTSGATTSISMAAGTSAQTFYLRGDSVGTHSMALALDSQNATLPMDIGPDATNRFIVLGLPLSITAGACSSSAVTVRREDQFGNLTTNGLLNVTLASSRFQFSTQSDCSSPSIGASVSIANGASVSTPNVYVTGTLAGMGASVDASAGSIMGTASTNISPAAATKLVFSTAPATKTLNVDQCSQLRGSHVVELQDQYNNRVTPGSAVTVNLTGSLAGVTFYGGAACGTSTTSVVLDSGNSTRTFVFRPVTTAPSSLDLTAAATGVTSAVDTWSIGVGAPALLDWPVTPTLDVPRFTCTDLGVVNIVDAALNATTLTGAAVISVANNRAGAGVTLHSDSACTSAPITSHSLSAGAGATPHFYVWATGSGGAVNFTPSSVPAPPNNGPAKPATVSGTAGSLVAAAASSDIEPGACVAVTVTRKDGSNVDVTKGVTPITFSVAAGNGLSVHAMSDCSDGNSGTISIGGSIAHGSATTTFYVRGRSNATPGTPVTLTAADTNGGSASGTVNVTSHSLVRRGTCTITDSTSSCTAALTPFPAGNDISRSFVVFTSTGSPTTTSPDALAAGDQDVECHLDTSSGVSVVCSRVGTTGQMDVSWQVASFGRSFAQGGVSVQHLTGSSTATSTAVTISSVTQAQSFILFSSQFSGADNHGDAFPVARLTSATNVEIVQNTTAARTYRLQVVSFAGATVVHQSGTALTGQNPNLTVAPSLSGGELGRAFALTMAQVTTDSTDADYMCKRRLRSTLVAGAINHRRGGSGSADTSCTTDNVALLAAQRVLLPAGNSVQSPAVNISTTNATADATGLTAVTTHRSLVFMGMQGPGGQSAGDGTYVNSGQDGDDTGYFHARAEFLTSTSIRLTRRASPASSTSSFQPFVVEFATP